MNLTPEEVYSKVRAHCLAKEGAVEEYPWDDVAWKVGGKMFACGSDQSAGLTVKSTLEKQAVLIQHPNITVAAYVGRYGWVHIAIPDEETLDLALELIDESYDQIRPKKRKSAGKVTKENEV
jgi:predicted DNA-binding protein (MmcQ/YjbR family)